jgi:lysophospholipase L1-like esterase
VTKGPGDRIRIVALGDSTTAGTPAFLSPVEAPPDGRGDETSQYAYWLMKTHPDWDVLNRGVNGERSDQIRRRFDRHVAAEKPYAVVIIAGVNDIYQGRGAETVTTELRALYDQAGGARIRVLAGTIIPFDTATAEQNARMREVNVWIQRQAGRDGNIDFVDTRGAVCAAGNADRLFESPDGLHPSPAGYRRMADAIGAILERVVQTSV